MTESHILTVERQPGLALLTMNRPPANALNADLILLLLERFRSLASEPVPPGIVLSGEGERFFSAGGDIKEVANVTVATATPRMRAFHALLCAMESYPAPFVCAVRGYAVGGAFEFLLHADYVVADSHCQVGFPEINNGLLPAAKGIRQAARQLGARAARALLYSGALIDSARALQIGAIDEVVETGDVAPRAIEVCREFVEKNGKLFTAIKRSINLTGQMDDPNLESMTLDDLGCYLDEGRSAAARTRFLQKSSKRV